MSIFERIQQKASENQLNQSDIARLLKLTRGSVNQWFNGSTKPGGENLVKLAKILRTSPEWLANGIGKSEVEVSEVKEDVLKRALCLVKKSERLSDVVYTLDEFSQKVSRVYFAIDNELSLTGLISEFSTDLDEIRAIAKAAFKEVTNAESYRSNVSTKVEEDMFNDALEVQLKRVILESAID